MKDQKTVLLEAVRGYLQDEHPDTIAEFDMVFDAVWSGLSSVADNELDEQDYSVSEGDEFLDGNAVGQATVAVASVVGYKLLKAIVKYTIEHDVPRLLDVVENKLIARTGDRELVHSLRLRIEGILKNL